MVESRRHDVDRERGPRGRSHRYQGWMAVAGGFLVHLTLGTVFSFGNLTSYVTSYVKEKVDADYTYEAASWIYTGNMVARGVFTAVGGYMEYRIGPRLTAAIGCAVATLGVWTTAFSIETSPWLLVLTKGVLFGCGIGLAYIAPLTCGMKWFPRNKGLVSGIVVGGFGLGSFIFSPIQTMFLNPNNMSVDKETGYFSDDDVLSRVPWLFHILGGSYAILQIIGCCLLRDPPAPEHSATIDLAEDESASLNAPRHQSMLGSLPASTSEQMVILSGPAVMKEDEKNDQEEHQQGLQHSFDDPSMSPLEMLRCKEFYMLYMTFFFNQQAIGYAIMMYKPFGQRFIDDDRFLMAVGTIASVFNTLGRVFWGALADRTSYRTSMLILTSLLVVLYASLEATIFGGRYMYGAWMLMIYFTFSGTFALLPPATSQTFGQRYAGPNYGLVFSNGIFAPIFQSVMLEHLSGVVGYLGILLITAGCVASSFLITLFYDKSPSPANIRGAMKRRHD